MDYELLRRLYDIESFVGYIEDELREMSEGFYQIPAALMDFWKTCGNTGELYTGSNDLSDEFEKFIEKEIGG